MNGLILVVKENLLVLINPIAIIILFFLLFNFAFAPWSWNPLDDFLYVRSDGLILPANHISSGLAVAITGITFVAKDPSRAMKTMFTILSTASIHEFVLDAENIPNFIMAHSLGYTITIRWMFWLSFFLIPGVYFATKRQRQIQIRIALFCIIYIGLWVVLANVLNIDTSTIIGYAPGPAYYSFIPNLFEVTSWVIPVSFWWIWR